MYGERVGEEVAVNAVGYCGKAYYGPAFFPGQFAAAAGDVSGVEEVLALREVAVVCLDGADGQDGDLVFSLRDAVEICGSQVPLIYFFVIFGHRAFPEETI